MRRRLFPTIILLLGLFASRPALAGWAEYYGWMVTHDRRLVGLVTPLEATRAALEAEMATQRGIESGIHSFATSNENYSWMRSYAQTIRLLRSLQRVKEGIALTSIPVWTLMPKIGFVQPVQYRDPETGQPLVMEKEVASLSLVPPNYQAHWLASDYIQDDESFGAPLFKGGGGKSLVKFIYPHSLSDVQLTLSPSPFLDDYQFDEAQAIDNMKAHFFEALIDAASRLSGFGISINPQVLASGDLLVNGRMTPQMIQTQALLLEQQAMETIDKIYQLMINHGVSFSVAERAVKWDRAYFDGFGSRMRVAGNARAMFAMNLMNEVHQVIGRLECYQRRGKVGESDEALAHIGMKKDPDGTWSGFFDNSSSFWDLVDKIAGNPSGARAIRLQAMGLSARYSRYQFDEAEGLRNILMGSERMKIALEGIQNEAAQKDEIEGIEGMDYTQETIDTLIQKKQQISDYLTALTWGGLTELGR